MKRHNQLKLISKSFFWGGALSLFSFLFKLSNQCPFMPALLVGQCFHSSSTIKVSNNQITFLKYVLTKQRTKVTKIMRSTKIIKVVSH